MDIKEESRQGKGSMTKTTKKKTVSKAVSRQRYSRITIKFYKKYQYEIK